MERRIGNIALNYKYYSGKDLYSDGDVENSLLDIVQRYSEEELEMIVAQSRDWAVLYHLSQLRKNIVDWLPMEKTDTVLEVGSGCGAITGALAKMTRKVHCVELSEKRSLINATRNQESNNIEIFLGNFKDVEKALQSYDYITLIGVFEYAENYIDTDTPYHDFLQILKKHLKKGGKLVIAIENRLGLKYWAGCREDHIGTFFEGLEGYRNSAGVRTFSKKEWGKMLEDAGFGKIKYYYPYPDYKFPLRIYSDEWLPQAGELSNNLNNFDRSRMVLFNETMVFDSLIAEGLFPMFSNSFLMVVEV